MHSLKASLIMRRLFIFLSIYLKMHKIHQITLKVIYQSDTSYEDLLELSVVFLFINDTCGFYLRKYIKALLMQTLSICSHFLRIVKFHIILGRVQCFSFHVQGELFHVQTLYIFATY